MGEADAEPAALPVAREAVEQFRSGTRERILTALSDSPPPPALRNALSGWLGAVDASIIDWVEHKDLTVDELTGLLLASFASALLAAQQADPTLQLRAV